ncbi:hypothetical protein DFP74_3455 [Nocardiopsis sp. Huas11]|uniref:hypothetical protein n=1 Tax=Nocardiopsis sp. Huas11 TaxID=2183912 RepID=UPI000EABA287|nr:hypothetical protein [Nocardiopsis sp. Huas11]RKS07771.1 hypothetical protein DFP74_3455 [Nocardiopsis sp. Huas11]
MRTAAKLTMTVLFTAGLLGLGMAPASAAGDAYETCVKEQTASGLLALNLDLLDLDLLNQCIAQHNS